MAIFICFPTIKFINLALFMKILLIIFGILIIHNNTSYAQDDEFCNAITTIINDAPNKFRNICGKEIQRNATATMWASGIKVPGTIGSRFVASMGLFYEGAFFQTGRIDELKNAYDKYRDLLGNCFGPQHYKMSTQPNFYPGLSGYKKVVFMPEVDSATAPAKAPAHITFEATYNKDIKLYTLVMYIFEH